MNEAARRISGWVGDWVNGWERFWFTPAPPHVLAIIRICAGAMLFYTHLVWGKNLMAFLGPNAWVTAETARNIAAGSYQFSIFFYIESPTLLWIIHIASLVIFAMLTVGLFTRVSSVLAFIMAVQYCHRLHGTLFGLDQMNTMLALYLMVGPCGAVFSVDRWIARLRSGSWPPVKKSVTANVALRLLQVHLCVIYFFSGVNKMKGELWWDGNAVWGAISNYEYQSFDLTWLAKFPFLVGLFSHATLFWETTYPALVWSRKTRPLVLAMAVAVHAGIAMFMGMITFGVIMIVANFAFVPADWLGIGGSDEVPIEPARELPPQKKRKRSR